MNKNLKSTCIALCFCIMVMNFGFSQELAVLQDHKPLLEEVHYGNRVGGVQAQEGESKQLIVIDADDILKSIVVCVAKLNEIQIVAGFQLELEKDGNTSMYSFGNLSGTIEEKFTVPNGRKLVGISGTSGWFVDSLQFIFDDGSRTPKYGGKGGDINFNMTLNKNSKGAYTGRLMGFWGSYTDYLESIGLVFWPIE